MINPPPFVDQLVQQLDRSLQDSGLRDNLQPLLRQAVEKAVSQLDLVSRSEFDAQLTRLARCEAELEALQQQLQQLLADEQHS